MKLHWLIAGQALTSLPCFIFLIIDIIIQNINKQNQAVVVSEE